jgi:hypothetical protein
MKTKLMLIAAIGISALTLSAGENATIENTTVEPGKFYNLIVNTNANIILTQGEENSVRIVGEKSEREKVQAITENGVLVINGKNSRAVDIYISAEEINLIEINGQARLFANGSISSDILLLKVNGTGSIKADIRALSVGMIVKGDGKIIVSGSCGESFQRIYGNGNIYSENLYSFKSSKEILALKEKNSAKKRATLKLQK